jgi:hypothetical protein
MRLHLDDEDFRPIPFDDEGFLKLRKPRAFERDVDDRSANSEDFSSGLRWSTHRNDRSSLRQAFCKAIGPFLRGKSIKGRQVSLARLWRNPP